MDKVTIETKINILQVLNNRYYLDKQVGKFEKLGAKRNEINKNIFEFEVKAEDKEEFLKKNEKLFDGLKTNFAGSKIQIRAPYCIEAINKFRMLGGSWNKNFNFWEFKNIKELKDSLLKILKEIYGYCYDSKAVDVKIIFKKEINERAIFLGGYTIAYTNSFKEAKKEDYVNFVSGNMSYYKNRVTIEKNSTFFVPNFPLDMVMENDNYKVEIIKTAQKEDAIKFLNLALKILNEERIDTETLEKYIKGLK